MFSPLIIIRGKDNNIVNGIEVKTLVMPKDPVCGVILDENTSKFKITYEGETYHFCSVKCKKRFKRHAAKFIK